MSRIALSLTCCLALVFMAADSRAADLGARRTVQDLYSNCKSDDAAGQAVCLRYLQGVLDTVRIGDALLSHASGWLEGDAAALETMVACGRWQVSGVDLKQAFIGWAERNPGQAHTRAVIGLWAVLDETGVCGPPWHFGRAKILDSVPEFFHKFP